MTSSFEMRLAERYGDLSGALQAAADYLVSHPVDLATRSLRSVSQDSGVSPAAYSRLARALGYGDLADLRDEMRLQIDQRVTGFAQRAERLHSDPQHRATGFFDAHLTACQRNLTAFAATIDRTALETATERLSDARRVLLLGALGSTGVVEYLSYMANFCTENWTLAGRMGASMGAAMADLGPQDALLIVTKPPFSGQALRAAELARAKGGYVVLITDSLGCPALKHASAHFVVPTDSPHFYSSYVVTVFLVESLIGMLISRSGPEARNRIARVEDANRVLAEVWDL